MLFEERLINDEGFEKFVYQDILGYDTIGVGFCIDRGVPGAGLRDEEIEFILANRLRLIKKELSLYDFYKNLDDNRREAILNMAYNLGVPKLLLFKHMISSLEERDWLSAHDEALNSKWARQLPLRAKRVAYCLKEGKWENN